MTGAVGQWIRRWPRLSAAIAFGAATGALTHFAWVPSARMSGTIPGITLGAGLAHALAGAVTGRRLLDAKRTPSAGHAALIGALTSLLALAFFAPAMAAFVSSSNVRPTGILAFAELTVLTGFFAFLAAGWALLLTSVAVGWGLYRLAAAAPVL